MLPRHTKRTETSCFAVMVQKAVERLSLEFPRSMWVWKVLNPWTYPVKAVEEVQRVAHRALVRVQTRTDDES